MHKPTINKWTCNINWGGDKRQGGKLNRDEEKVAGIATSDRMVKKELWKKGFEARSAWIKGRAVWLSEVRSFQARERERVLTPKLGASLVVMYR